MAVQLIKSLFSTPTLHIEVLAQALTTVLLIQLLLTAPRRQQIIWGGPYHPHARPVLSFRDLGLAWYNAKLLQAFGE